MAELSTPEPTPEQDCCQVEALASCCEPAEKADCCGAGGSICGCGAGSGQAAATRIACAH